MSQITIQSVGTTVLVLLSFSTISQEYLIYRLFKQGALVSIVQRVPYRILISVRLSACINYIMQQNQPITINQHFIRHNSKVSSVIINPPSLPAQQPHLLYPPAPQRFPVRPASSTSQRPPLAHSFVPRPNSQYPHLDRQLQLDSMARVVCQQQQRKACEASGSSRRSSREKNSEFHRNHINSYHQTGCSLHPDVNGAMKTNLTGSTPLIPEKDKIPSPFSQQFYQKSCHQEGTQYDFKLDITDNRNVSIRQSKTDREQPQKNSLVLGYSITPEAKVIVPSSSKYQFITKDVIKPEKRELDSTVNSSLADKVLQKKQSMQSNLSTRQSDYILKKNSPLSIWPLSISPSEEKRQSFILDQSPKIEMEKAQTNTQDSNNNEFKKKKNFQFLRNLRKKFSNASTFSQPSRVFEISDFQLMDKIGKGAFGDVFMARQKATGFLCVIKKLQKKKLLELKLEEQLVREIKIQSFLTHRHLTSLYGFFSDQAYIYLILEPMPDGSLMQVKKKRKIPEAQVSYYVRQICLGLKYMHNENVIHRDIKPENIFLNDTYAKIGDFGCSIFTQTNRNTQIGSFAYISPEQLKLESYNEKIDVWSLGVMTYEMLVGTSPFEADIIEITKKGKAPELSQLTFPESCQLSHDAREFLEQLLNTDPQERLGIDEALRHEFIQKYLKNQGEGERHSF